MAPERHGSHKPNKLMSDGGISHAPPPLDLLHPHYRTILRIERNVPRQLASNKPWGHNWLLEKLAKAICVSTKRCKSCTILSRNTTSIVTRLLVLRICSLNMHIYGCCRIM